MATILMKPERVTTFQSGSTTCKINVRIIPDGMVAPHDVAAWCRKGERMKPCAKLNDGSGRPRGICIHNTVDIKLSTPETNAAEQYTRSTFNGNMKGVVVHFYVWGREIWQNLDLNERGWHATDGHARNTPSKRPGEKKLGGNMDTIAIECIGPSALSEDTTARLTAWLCEKFDFDPDMDVYQHHDFYPKNCPEYIRPHWQTFLDAVRGYAKQGPFWEPERILESNDLVAFRPGTAAYYPGGPAVPAWAIADYNHRVTQTQLAGKDVRKGGKRCVLLGKMTKKAGGAELAGVNTWVDEDVLTVVKSAAALAAAK